VDKPLQGGHGTPSVRRVGDTVVRTAGPWTPAVHRLLRHVAPLVPYDVPLPLAHEGGEETLTYVPGVAPQYPMPPWVWTDDVLVAVMEMVRALHDATATFVPSPDDVWRRPVREPREVVCHNDVAPYNVVFRDERPAGLIDLDMAAPGPRVWDVAYAAYRFVPLARSGNPDVPPAPDAERLRRLALACEAYGLDAGLDAGDVLRAVPERLDAVAADPVSVRLGHSPIYVADAAWVRSLTG
jgi:hypothetical protein